MSERDLYRAVARATGEFVESIQKIGFHLLEAGSTDARGATVIDWDAGQPTSLGNVLSDDDWPARVDPLPSWDEVLDEELTEEFIGAAA